MPHHCAKGDECSCQAPRAACPSWRWERPDDQPPAPAARARLRDEFAMAALTGLLAAPDTANDGGARIVRAAYGYADAMLDARERRS